MIGLLFGIYIFIGVMWMIAQIAKTNDNNYADKYIGLIETIFSVDKFLEGNIFGKLLIIIKCIFLLPFIVLVLGLILFVFLTSKIIDLLNKLCGWDD